MATYNYTGNTQQFDSPHQNIAVALKVDTGGNPVFTKLAEAVADVNGDFTLEWEDWDGRVIIGAVDDDGSFELNCKFVDWKSGELLPSPYSITNLTLLTTFPTPEVSIRRAVSWNSDSSRVFVIDNDSSNRNIKEYDVASGSHLFTSPSFLYSTNDMSPSANYSDGLILKQDDPGSSNYKLRTVTFNTPDTMSDGITFSSLTSYTVRGASGIHLLPNNTTLYLIETAADRVMRYTMSVAGDVETASLVQSSDYLDNLGLTTSDPSGLHVTPDGTKLFVSQSSVLHEFTMSSPHDLSTLSLTGNSFNMPSGCDRFRFNIDGTRLVMYGFSGVVWIYDSSVA